MARGYRTNDYSFVIDNSFQPFSMQEMLMPFLSYKEAYEKQEAAYQDLVDKTDTFKYLERVAEENPDSKAAQIYKGYADEMNRQFSDFSQNGLSMANRRALTNLKKRYQGEIGRLMKADEAMSKERELRRAMNGKDSSMLYATDNLNIDDFLDGSNPNLYNISGTELYTRGAAAGKAASSRIYSAGDEGSTLNGYYRKWVERNGYSKESMDAFRANASAIPELQQAADAILAERGVLENLNGSNLERARQSVLNGIIDGAVYQESVKPVRDEGKMSAAAATQYGLQREARDFERQINGFRRNPETKEWEYHEDKDLNRRAAVEKAEAIAKAKNAGKTGGGSSGGSRSGGASRIAGFEGIQHITSGGNGVRTLEKDEAIPSSALRTSVKRNDDGSYTLYLTNKGEKDGTLGKVTKDGRIEIEDNKKNYSSMFNYDSEYDDDNIRSILREIYEVTSREGNNGYMNYQYYFDPDNSSSSNDNGGYYREALTRFIPVAPYFGDFGGFSGSIDFDEEEEE